MFLVIFIIWLLLNAHFAFDERFLQIVIIGLLLSTVIYLFLIKLTKWDFKTDMFFVKRIHLFIWYGLALFYEVIVSNLKVVSLILKHRGNPEPQIIKISIDLKSDLLRTILANSITLTPGTITISCEKSKDNKGVYIIHCLRKEYFEGLENGRLVKILQRMEGNK